MREKTKLWLVPFTLLILLTPPALAIHTKDTNATYQTILWNNTNPANISYTAGTGSSVMVLAIFAAGTTYRTGGTPTFNGKNFTSLGRNIYTPSPEGSSEMWYLLLTFADTGSAHTVSVPNTGGHLISYNVATFKSATGESVLDTNDSVNALAANPSQSLTTTRNGDVIVSGLFSGLGTPPPVTAPGVMLYSNDGGAYAGASQYYLQTDYGMQSIGWTGSSDDYSMQTAAFKESGTTYTITGRVVDVFGVAVSGAVISSNVSSQTNTTNATGWYSFNDINGIYTLSAEQTGYSVNSIIVSVNGSNVSASTMILQKSFAYISNSGSSSVSVIDTSNNTVTATVPVGNYPTGVAVNLNGTRVYVVNQLNNNVSVIDTATNTVIASVNVGSTPNGVAVNPNGTRVYVTNFVSNNVSVINTSTNTVIASVTVGSYPFGVAVNPAGTRVYVLNWFSNTVSVINTSTNTVTATVPVGTNPYYGVAVNPAGTRVYVVNEFDKNVSVIDTATNTVTASVNVGLNPYSFGQFIVTPIATPLVPINITSHGNNVTNNNSLTITVNQSTNVRFNVTTDISIFANITSISEGVISLGNDTLGKVTFWADFLFPKYGTQWVNLSFKNTTGSSLSDYRNWTVNVLDNIAPNQVTNLTNATISVHNAIHLTWDVGTDNSGGSGIKDYFIDVMNNSINWLTIPRPTINASNISSGYTKDAYWYTLRNTVPVNCSGCHSTLGTKEYAIGNFWMKFNSTHLFIMAHLPDNDINTSDDYVGFGFDPLRNGGTYPQTDDRWYELYENGSLATFTGNGTAWISNTTNALRSVKGAGNGTNLTYGAPRYEIAIPLSELGNPTNGSAVNFILEIECQDGWDFQKRSSFFPVAGVYDNPSTWTTLTYRNSTQWDTIGTSTTNSYEATQLLSNFRYNFSVRARDNVSNIGNRSINYTGQTADRNGYNISGYITSGGSPVIGAHIKTGEYIVDSDSNGFYILTDLANYTYTLIATASRHGSNSTNVTLNGSDIPNVNMSLEYIPPSLYDSRDTSPPSEAGYWAVNEDVSLTGYGWDSYETIRIKINKSGTTLNTSYITADANGAFINKYINLGTGYATGIYNIYVSTNGGSTYVLYDTFSVTGVTWYRPSYQNETLGAVGDIITVTASSNSKRVRFTNYTWKYPNGTIAYNSGFIRATRNAHISNNFLARVSGAWTIEVQFSDKNYNAISDQFSSTAFGVSNIIKLSASPLNISANNVTKSRIIAYVTNISGGVVANNIVNFTTNLGTLSNGIVSGVTTLTATTNSSGFASVNLTSAINGTATITAVEQLKGSDSIFIAVGVNYILLYAYPEEIIADGISTSTIKAIVTYDGIIPAVNNVVNFTTTFGTLSNGTVSGVTQLTNKTDVNGTANATLKSVAATGQAIITARESSGGNVSVSVGMFTLSAFSDGYYNLSQEKFPKEQDVFVSATGLDDKKKYQFYWYYPNGTLASTSPVLTGNSSQTDFWSIPSGAQESTNWTIILKDQKSDATIYNYIYTVVRQANITLTPQEPYVGGQVNATASTLADPQGSISVNFTWTAPNGTIMRSVENTAIVNQSTDEFTPDTNGTWILNVTFLNANGETIDVNSKSFTVTLGCSIAISESFSEISWDAITSLPAVNQNATGNNGSGITMYNISIITSGCTADIYMKADGNLTAGSNIIGLNNETYRASVSDNTVAGATYTPLNTTYGASNLIGSNLGSGANIYLKFFMSVPGAQPAGSYNNTVHINGVRNGTLP